MSSAGDDTWSQADSDQFSLTSSPMSDATFELDFVRPGLQNDGTRHGVQNIEDEDSSGHQGRLPSQGLRRSLKYRMSKDDIVTVIAEDTAFEIHTSFFRRESHQFRKLLDANNGTSSPIFLPDTTALDLERFLDLLDPGSIGDYSGKSAEEWMSILRVAHRWGFTSIHRLSLQKLEPIASAVDKVVCARTLGAEHWLIEAYTELCKRNQALTLEEARRLGLEEVVCLWETTLDARDDVPRAGKQTLARHGRLPECLLDGEEAQKDDGTPEPLQSESKECAPSFAIPAYRPTYKNPPLDIYDANRQPNARSSGKDLLLYPEGCTISIRRDASRLNMTLPSKAADFLYINGVQQIMTEDDYQIVELTHGDVFAFFGQALVSQVARAVVCLPSTGYIVWRADTFLQFNLKPSSPGGWNQEEKDNTYRQWKENLIAHEAIIAAAERSLAALMFCMEIDPGVSNLKKYEETTVRADKDHDSAHQALQETVKSLACAALLRAGKPFVTSW